MGRFQAGWRVWNKKGCDRKINSSAKEGRNREGVEPQLKTHKHRAPGKRGLKPELQEPAALASAQQIPGRRLSVLLSCPLDSGLLRSGFLTASQRGQVPQIFAESHGPGTSPPWASAVSRGPRPEGAPRHLALLGQP